MIEEKLISDDPTWDVRAHEDEVRLKLDADIRDLEGNIALAEKALALRASPGWEPFLQQVRANLAVRTDELILCKTPHETALLQGRVRELRAVLGLMQQAEGSVAVLQARLQERKTMRSERFVGDKMKPQGVTS